MGKSLTPTLVHIKLSKSWNRINHRRGGSLEQEWITEMSPLYDGMRISCGTQPHIQGKSMQILHPIELETGPLSTILFRKEVDWTQPPGPVDKKSVRNKGVQDGTEALRNDAPNLLTGVRPLSNRHFKGPFPDRPLAVQPGNRFHGLPPGTRVCSWPNALSYRKDAQLSFTQHKEKPKYLLFWDGCTSNFLMAVTREPPPWGNSPPELAVVKEMFGDGNR